jgi:hypothetical protein
MTGGLSIALRKIKPPNELGSDVENQRMVETVPDPREE